MSIQGSSTLTQTHNLTIEILCRGERYLYESNQMNVQIKDSGQLRDVLRRAAVVIINTQLPTETRCPSDISFRFTRKYFVKINEAHGYALILDSLFNSQKRKNGK